jgi:hypothetical protein
MLLAHFTPAELPGTATLVVIGCLIGLCLMGRARLAPVLALLLSFGVLGMLADGASWSQPVRLAIDLAYLTLAAGLALALLLPRSRAGHAQTRAREGLTGPPAS